MNLGYFLMIYCLYTLYNTILRIARNLLETRGTSQNSQQKSVTNLNVLTVAFLALKKMVFLKKNIFFSPFFNATFQCGRYGVFKIQNFFLTPKKWKNRQKKLLIIGPDPFLSQSSPDQRPTAQNWFFILWNLGTRHLFSYLWAESG